MNIKFMDQCFKARMEVLRNRFPIKKFKDLFVQEFARNGIVYIQPKTLDIDDIYADRHCGLIFGSQEYIETAIRLLRRWGFYVEVRHERNDWNKWAYAIMLPEKYLRNKQSCDILGERRTALRSLKCWEKWCKETLGKINLTPPPNRDVIRL